MDTWIVFRSKFVKYATRKPLLKMNSFMEIEPRVKYAIHIPLQIKREF